MNHVPIAPGLLDKVEECAPFEGQCLWQHWETVCIYLLSYLVFSYGRPGFNPDATTHFVFHGWQTDADDMDELRDAMVNVSVQQRAVQNERQIWHGCQIRQKGGF